MQLDVVEVCGLAESWVVPVQVLQPQVDVWVAFSDGGEVTLEVLDVNWVESDDGSVQSDVGLGDLVTDDEVLGQDLGLVAQLLL